MKISSGNSGVVSLGSSMAAQEAVAHRTLKMGHQVWV